MSPRRRLAVDSSDESDMVKWPKVNNADLAIDLGNRASSPRRKRGRAVEREGALEKRIKDQMY